MIGSFGPAPHHQAASEDFIALAFTKEYQHTLKFDHDLGCWFRWDGACWRQEGTSFAFDCARLMARRMSDGRAALRKSSVARGVEAFARADRAHAVRSDIWDRDPFLLATPGGVVDLRTGKLGPAAPHMHITKLTSVLPEDGEPTLWLEFLSESLGHDEQTIRFVQQWFGYALTGDTREQALTFAYGPGGNGKSVWLKTMATIMGDYAVTAARETFTASKHDRHPTDKAMLRGARLVTASETDEGRSWAESLIKVLTGGDRITARFMNRNNFTFCPELKLTIAGNHAPRLSNVDEAMRRRFNILPFMSTPKAPDRLLETKLTSEHGRILNWAIKGCLDWQTNGLIRPMAVQEATDDYFKGEDAIGQWLAERCCVQSNAWEQPSKLFADWQSYSAANGEMSGTNTDFGRKLTARGFASASSNGSRKRIGLRLNPVAQVTEND